MAKQIEIQIGSQTYSGKTKTAATEAALAHLAALFPERESECWNPVIIRTGEVSGHTVGVVFKDTTGFWAYRLDREESGMGSVTSSNWTRQQAEYHCRRHLAQDTYRPKYEAESMEILHKDDAEGRDSHARWLKFQTTYTEARARGLTIDQARAAAYGFSHTCARWPLNGAWTLQVRFAPLPSKSVRRVINLTHPYLAYTKRGRGR